MADLIKVVVAETAALLTLAEAKDHIRYTEDDQDDLITGYANAAVLSCLNNCDLKLVPQGAEPVFKAAALLVLGDLWSNRSSVIVGTIVTPAPSVANLLKPHRVIRV